MTPEMRKKIEALIAKRKQGNFEKDKDGDKKSESMEGDEGGSALDATAVIKAIADGTISIADFAEIEAAMASALGGTEDVVEDVAQEVAVTPGEAMSKKTGSGDSDVMSPKEAKMQARIEVLENANLANADAASAKDEVELAYGRLKDRPLGADLRDRLVSFRKTHGKEAFGAYVDELAKTTGVLPTTDSAAENFGAQGGEVNEVAMAYHEQGAEAVERASNFCAQHKELVAAGSNMSLKRYVELNMKRAV